jgi:hypothetical protein
MHTVHRVHTSNNIYIYIYIYKMHELCVLLNVSPTDCVFFHKLNANFVCHPVATGELMSTCPLVLCPLVAMGG